MYSAAPAQEQGARLPASRHRRLDFLQNSGQQLFLRKSSVARFSAALTASYYLCQRLNRAKKLQKKKFFALQSMVPGVSYKDDKRKELEK